ncbi:putative DHHC-type Zn-finger protein [Pseudoloma neurophilia]|uniref:Palmitoyltransferase n=1 Tax=Pseudoloma neurophilia TaxID=146866 RepID=A0A0R0M165_9MICR|nr:putative DHHC-type Zn-finger protein [Pseudoloma neurophilia]
MKRRHSLPIRLLYSALSITYPLITIYSYFVFVGKYCILAQAFDCVVVLIYFLIFHLLLIFNLIFYMRILGIDDTSTANRFKGKGVDKKYLEKSFFNPFIYQEIESKKRKMLKKCDVCQTYKPPRAHHCTICNKCFLKYDHHCLFLGVCIAFYNYKFFYLFSLTSIIYNIFVITLLMINLLRNKILKTNPKVHFIMCILSSSIILIFCLKKLIKHSFNISRNETTTEAISLDAFYRGDQGLVYIFQEGLLVTQEEIFDRPVMNPYNLGVTENWLQIFGNEWNTWLLPISTTPGDGINYPKR